MRRCDVGVYAYGFSLGESLGAKMTDLHVFVAQNFNRVRDALKWIGIIFMHTIH